MRSLTHTAGLRARERLVIEVASKTACQVSALSLLLACGWLVVVEHNHQHADWQAGGRLAWSLSILAAVAFIARGIFLGRPVTAIHALAAAAFLSSALMAHLASVDAFADAAVAAAGLALMWPTTLPPDPDALPRVWALIDQTRGDPLAPFAMHSRKSAYFNAESTAMLAYRTRIGFAVVSGDPIGDPERFPELVQDFYALCRTRGWRLLVLGCSARRLPLWLETLAVRPSLRAVPFGRDVVIDVRQFDMVGRGYRNLRQAVRRTHNAGISTAVVDEADLDDALRAELTDVLDASHSGVRTERGFSMILDQALQGRQPGVVLAIARDRSGRVQAVHRYALAGHGEDVSLDVPWRRPGAPNGIDERLSVDVINWAKEHGGRRLSLAFAAFPEIFDDANRPALQRVFYVLIHLGDRLIRLESLYRYLRKYHALGERRYVLLSLRHLLPALVVLLTLEFLPHPRRLPRQPAAIPGDQTPRSGRPQSDLD